VLLGLGALRTSRNANAATAEAAIAASPAPEAPLALHPLIRLGWILGGFGLLTAGVIGILVPGWPTTIFVVLASACFVRGEPRLARWLERHPVFGRFMAMARHGMPIRAKIVSIAAMWIAIASSSGWMLFIRDEPLTIPAILTLLMGVAGTVAILRARSPTRDSPQAR